MDALNKFYSIPVWFLWLVIYLGNAWFRKTLGLGVAISLARKPRNRFVWMQTRHFEVNLAINTLKIPSIFLPAASSQSITYPSRVQPEGHLWDLGKDLLSPTLTPAATPLTLHCKPAQPQFFCCLSSIFGETD